MEGIFGSGDYDVDTVIMRCLAEQPERRKERLGTFLKAATAEFVRLAELGPANRDRLQEAQFLVLLKAIKEASQNLWVMSLAS